MTLTREKLDEMVQMFRAHGPQGFRDVFQPMWGIPVNIVPEWPQVPYQDTVRIPAHPIVKWLAKWLPIDPWVDVPVTKHRDMSPYMLYGKLFVSPVQHHHLITAITTA